jgi:hypothetical protein
MSVFRHRSRLLKNGRKFISDKEWLVSSDNKDPADSFEKMTSPSNTVSCLYVMEEFYAVCTTKATDTDTVSSIATGKEKIKGKTCPLSIVQCIQTIIQGNTFLVFGHGSFFKVRSSEISITVKGQEKVL